MLNNKTMQHKDGAWAKAIKQWWHETHILPSELIELGTPKICYLAPKMCSLHHAPPNNKTTVENKAYDLPSGVIKLMTPQTGSVDTKNYHLWEGDFSK